MELGRTIVQNEEIRATVRGLLKRVADNTVTTDTIRAELRATVRGLFPAEPSAESIAAVTGSPLWADIVKDAKDIYTDAFFKAPRIIAGKSVDHEHARKVFTAPRKDVKSMSDADKVIRRGIQKYIDTGVKQSVTDCIPDVHGATATATATAGAGAGSGEVETPPVLDATALLAAVDAWLATNPGKTLVDNFFREVMKRQPK
jgi:hypothetical protein